MTIEEIRQICFQYEGVTEDIKWGKYLCFSVAKKMFLITGPDELPPTASIKVTDEAFEELPLMQGFMPAPYLARYKWIYIDDISRWTHRQWQSYLEAAYTLVRNKLPKKKQPPASGDRKTARKK